MAAFQHTSSLICPVCGRHISRPAADLKGTAAVASCPSCGTITARATSMEDTADAAATQRMAPLDIVEESTAFLAPPSRNTSPEASASTHSEALEQAGDAASWYRTSAATQPVNASAPSAPAQDPQTAPEPESLAAFPERTAPQPDRWRNPWLIGSVVLVLLILFVGGILLSQAPGHAVSPLARITPAPAATSTVTATPPAGYVRVEDASRLYSFFLPSSWLPVSPPSPKAEFTTYTDPLHDATFEVESFRSNTGPAGAALDNLVLTSSFPAHAVSNISGPVTTSLAGVTWIKESASLVLQQNGATERNNLAVQTTTYNGITFIIFDSSPVAANSDSNAQALPTILDSFTFLG